LIEVEHRYLFHNFTVNYLKEETGLNEEFIQQYFFEKYNVSFELWLRSARVGYLNHLFCEFGASLSLREYATFTGYTNIESMLADFKNEKGGEFPLLIKSK
ncbi:MAG: hypothetical protein EA341_02760, partial [Mongoliibacter sp.]|uniref:hypothetical protein n=1 Tax=Mongoliibacter sp. TaxID=2022438 RepID=UPI0012F1D676